MYTLQNKKIMKKKNLSLLIIPGLLTFVLFSGCYYDAVISDVSIYSGEQVSFAESIVPQFTASCSFSGCHSSGAIAPDLTAPNAYNALINGDYININNPEQSELYQWVNGNRNTPMPVSGTDPKIVSSVLSWIEQGAQNN